MERLALRALGWCMASTPSCPRIPRKIASKQSKWTVSPNAFVWILCIYRGTSVLGGCIWSLAWHKWHTHSIFRCMLEAQRTLSEQPQERPIRATIEPISEHPRVVLLIKAKLEIRVPREDWFVLKKNWFEAKKSKFRKNRTESLEKEIRMSFFIKRNKKFKLIYQKHGNQNDDGNDSTNKWDMTPR